MLNRIAGLVAIATVGLAALSNSADAARFSNKGPSFSAGHRTMNPGRHIYPTRPSFSAGHRTTNPGRHIYPKRPSFTAGHATINPGRYGRRSFRSATGVARSKAACGTWVCTWRTSSGGCLVWEKTVCKIINPFD